MDYKVNSTFKDRWSVVYCKSWMLAVRGLWSLVPREGKAMQ